MAVNNYSISRTLGNGLIVVKNNRTGDEADQTFATEAEAVAWCETANANAIKFAEEMKARAAIRRKPVDMPTEFLTSRGDGFEGNG